MFRAAALLALLVAGSAKGETVALAQGEVVWASLTQPTDRYDHRVFGDLLPWNQLEIAVNTCIACAGLRLRDVFVVLPPGRVFEDIEARVADLDGDGRKEVIVVETDIARGATLAIYDATGKRAATEPVGQTHRWLAPAGIGDFDGDGRVEIAYVDRPHLARELVIVRYAAGRLTEIDRSPGYTNHRLGDRQISGGLRTCAGVTDLILASDDWSRILAVRLLAGRITRTDLGPLTRAADLRRAMDCA